MAKQRSTSAVRRGTGMPPSSSRSVPCASAVCTVMAGHLSGRLFAFFGLLFQFLGLVMSGKRVDDLIQFAVHDEIQLVQGQADAMIGDAILRKVVGADLFAAI